MNITCDCLRGGAQIGGEFHFVLRVATEQFWKILFMDRNNAVTQHLHFGLVVVDAYYAMPYFREACRSNKSYISRTDDSNGNWLAHEPPCKQVHYGVQANRCIEIFIVKLPTAQKNQDGYDSGKRQLPLITLLGKCMKLMNAVQYGLLP